MQTSCLSDLLNSGETHCFDEPTQKLLLLLDATDNDDECAMSCKAVYECADIKAPTFDNCNNRLPPDPTLDCGAHEFVENNNVGV